MWGSTRTNAKGKYLACFAIWQDLCALNHECPTFPIKTSHCSCVDITFVYRDIFPRCRWFINLEIHGCGRTPPTPGSGPFCPAQGVTVLLLQTEQYLDKLFTTQTARLMIWHTFKTSLWMRKQRWPKHFAYSYERRNVWFYSKMMLNIIAHILTTLYTECLIECPPLE